MSAMPVSMASSSRSHARASASEIGASCIAEWGRASGSGTSSMRFAMAGQYCSSSWMPRRRRASSASPIVRALVASAAAQSASNSLLRARANDTALK